MSTVITIDELQNVEAVAMKYIAQNLGLNIRPRKARFVEEERLWKIPLQAIVPRRVTKRNHETKTFIYRLNDVGHLQYSETDKTFQLVSSPSSNEIEREIAQRFSDLTECIERELLKEGRINWGRLPFIRTFLRPMYEIVVNILSRKKMNINTCARMGHWKFAELLIHEEYIEIDRERPKYLIPTNNLTQMSERLYREEKMSAGLLTIAELVVGNVFANQYDKIKTDLHIYPPTAYVDTTKVYYVDAVRFGENIPMGENDLFFEYQKIGARALSPDTSMPRFRTVLTELVAAELLDRRGDYITGRERIFNNLMEYREDILQGAVEAPSVVEIG